MVSAGEHCHDLDFSFFLGDFSGVVVRHPCGKDLGEFVESRVLSQKRLELFGKSKLQAKAPSRRGGGSVLRSETILEIVFDFSTEFGVVVSRFQRDVELEGFGRRERGGGGNYLDFFHELGGRVEGILGSNNRFGEKIVGFG